jgi:hypothetical protein
MAKCHCGTEADELLKLREQPVCRVCAHNASHSFRLEDAHLYFKLEKGAEVLPCPVTDGKNNVIPWGTYPNIDWS